MWDLIVYIWLWVMVPEFSVCWCLLKTCIVLSRTNCVGSLSRYFAGLESSVVPAFSPMYLLLLSTYEIGTFWRRWTISWVITFCSQLYGQIQKLTPQHTHTCTHVAPHHTTPRHATPRHATPRHTTLWNMKSSHYFTKGMDLF